MLEQTLVKLHLANLVYSHDNKIGTFGGTNIGELIKQFESQVKLYWLMHLYSGKTTWEMDQKQKRRMVQRWREYIGDAYILDDKSSGNNLA